MDLSRVESVATLERWAAVHPQLKGVRPMLQDLPDTDWIAHAPHLRRDPLPEDFAANLFALQPAAQFHPSGSTR